MKDFRQWEFIEGGARARSALDVALDRPTFTEILLISGRTGGGKSMFATAKVVEELRSGHRPVVTNLALDLASLQEYLLRLGCRVHVLDRVRILTRDETFNFWRFRGVELELDMPRGEDEPDWAASQSRVDTAGGVFYCIDEVHKFFGIERKIEAASPLFMWASQHRKLKDTALFVTQSVENFHSKVRRLCHRCAYVQYLARQKYKGFRKGNGFRVDYFPSVEAAKAGFAEDSETFKLDTDGLASCYFTAGGVGMPAAGKADGGLRVRALHVRWVWAGFVVALLLLCFGLFQVPKLMGRLIIPATIGKIAPGAAASKVEAKRAAPVAPLVQGVFNPTQSKAGLVIEGIMRINGGAWVASVGGEWIGCSIQGPFIVLADGRVGRLKKKVVFPLPVPMVESARGTLGNQAPPITAK